MATGSDCLMAAYNGDGNQRFNQRRVPTAEPLTITQATPTIATSPRRGGAVGTSIADRATVSGGFSPRGNVTFNLFAASGHDLHQDPAEHRHNPLSAAAPTSGPYTTTTTGTY